MTDDAWLARLEEEHSHLTLDRFDRADAWALGRAIAERGLAESVPIAVDIRTGSGILFHASLPGATADNDSWVDKKSATALRFETSTALLEARVAAGGRDSREPGWLDSAIYAVAGGSVPVRVRGVGVVAVATVSGLPSSEDHTLVADALRALADAQRS